MSLSPLKMMKFGLYFYPWYCSAKWKEYTKLNTPLIGEYQSDSECVISWQIRRIVESGVDYLIFELPSIKDWSFSVCEKAIDSIIHIIREENFSLGYTFLLDVTSIKSRDFFTNEISLLLNFLSEKQWDVGITSYKNNKKLMYVFAPYPDHAVEISGKYKDVYDLYFPATFPHWGELPFSFGEPDLEPYTLNAIKNKISLLQDLGSKKFIQFWSPSDQLQVIKKIGAVIPGYNDLHLARKAQFMPVVSRERGRTFFEQFKKVVDAGADNILIYSWNEYFEATTIEPTIEYGDFYVRLTRRLIEQAKEGVAIHFPDDMINPQPAAPIYLTPELERTAQRHPDKVPRWDQDYYVANIDLLSHPVAEKGYLIFHGVRVTNVGLKTWKNKIENERVRLGIRLYDSSGFVVREGRAELSNSDMPEGQSVIVDLAVEVNGLVPGDYRAEIDLVWEEKFWFKTSITKLISLL